MTKTPIRIVALFALIASACVVAIPGTALAAPTIGTAEVDKKHSISGSQETFTFNVKHGGKPSLTPLTGGPSPINRVEIYGDPEISVIGGSSAGWTFTNPGGTSARFSSGQLQAGATASFTIIANVPAGSSDATIEWSVIVSDNGGATATLQNPASPGALSTQVHILSVGAINLSEPTGSEDNGVTAGQDNLVITALLNNHSSVPLAVEPSLTSNVTGDSIESPGSINIPSGGSMEADFALNLSDAQTPRTLTAGATSGLSSAKQTSLALAVEPAATFAYLPETILPSQSASGATEAFSLSVTKAGPALALDEEQTSLLFTNSSGSFEAHLSGPVSLPAGQQSVGLNFASVQMPPWDGEYSATIKIEGTDANGATVEQVIELAGPVFKIDNEVPYATPILGGPVGQVTPEGIAVVADGQTLAFSGELLKSDGSLDRDPTATIVGCRVLIRNLANVPVTAQSLSSSQCSSADGVISGSAQLNSSIDEGVAFLEVEAKDPAGNVSGEIVSQGFVLIDNKIPTPFQVATECPTIGPCTETSRVVVEFSEPIKGAFLPVEFQVGGHVVTGLTTTCSTTTRCNKLTLSVTPALMPDERPQVTYTHIGAPVVRPRAQDDALNALSDFAVQAQDGVAPPLPSLDAVTQDGVDQAGGPIVNARSELTTGFHTNQERPTFSLSGLPIEGEGGIADDVDGSGDYEPTIDNVIVRCDADLAGSSACTPPPSTWSADGEYLLLAMAWDKNGTVSRGAGPNLGVRGDGFTLTIDNIAPSATGFSPTGTDLLVNFTEVIEYGPNRAADWNPIARVDEDTWRWISITRVTGTGDSRTLDVEDDDYVPGTATKVFFSMEGDAPDRPQDRAGNYLLNQTVLPH